MYQYADDTALVITHEDYNTAVSILQDDIKQIMSWFSKSSIFVNNGKSNLMCFRTHQKRINLNQPIFLHSWECRQCSCSPLLYASETRYLGIHFDEYLSWNHHIDYLLKHLRIISSYLYKLRSSASINLRRLIYQMLGESKLRYGIHIYALSSKYKLQKINNLIKKMIQNMTYGTQLESLSFQEQLSELQLLTVDDLHKFMVLTKYYFTHNFKIPSAKEKQLRHTERFDIPRIYTNYGKRLRKYYVPTYFNNLPDSLLNLQSLAQVKKEMRKWCSTPGE